MLKQRIATGIILFFIALAAIFYLPPFYFSIFVGLILLAAGWEWLNLCQIKQLWLRIVYLIVLAFVMLAANYIPLLPFLIGIACWWILALVLVCFYPRSSGVFSSKTVRMLLGFIVLVPAWLAIVTIKASINGAWTLIFMFALIWAADIGAYFSGRWWGRRKLMPAVSPGKTWEGFLGGLLLSLLIAELGMTSMQVLFETWWVVLGIVLLLNIFSVTGDLFESMLKRQVGLKDSGNLLPGHGGILDRIDSVTAAAPIFLLGLLLHWYY